MSPRFLASLALRMFGIYALVVALEWGALLGQAAIEWAASASPPSEAPHTAWTRLTPGTFGAFAVWLAAGILCSTKAEALARRWAGTHSELPGASSRVDARVIEQVGYRLVGVLVIATHMPQVVEALAELATGGALEDLWRYRLGALAAVAIGFYLLLGARGLANVVDRARGVGLDPSEQAWKAPQG